MGDVEKALPEVHRPETAHTATTNPPSRAGTFDIEPPPIPTGPSILGQKYGMSGDDAPHPPRHSKSFKSLRNPKSLNSLTSASQRFNVDSLPGTPHNGPPSTLPGAEEEQEELEQELAWGPSHPCFPHMNPHVPLASAEHQSTRIIRIKRDWMVRGDLAPTYSNLYPEILDPLLPEGEFRNIIHHVNKTLVDAYDPFRLRNFIDGFMGLATGWLWEDAGLTGIKAELKRLEMWFDDWNRRVGEREAVKLIPLRRTAYMNLDIQIPDPQLKLVRDDERSRPGTRKGEEDVR